MVEKEEIVRSELASASQTGSNGWSTGGADTDPTKRKYDTMKYGTAGTYDTMTSTAAAEAAADDGRRGGGRRLRLLLLLAEAEAAGGAGARRGRSGGGRCCGSSTSGPFSPLRDALPNDPGAERSPLPTWSLRAAARSA